MGKLHELRERRQQLITEARQILDTAEGENRALNQDETTAYDAKYAEVRQLNERIERLTGQTEMERAAPAARSQGRIVAEADPGDGEIGMTDQERRSYSLTRAIRAAADGDWSNAGLELEAHRAAVEARGKPATGFLVPADIVNAGRREARASELNIGTPADGGYLVATDIDRPMIELLRNKLMVQAAGATILNDLTGNLAIPRQTGGATAYWVAEDGDVTLSTPQVGQVPLSPKTVGASTSYSRKLLIQSSIDIEMFVRNDLMTTLAIEIDRVALHGTATNNQPRGVAATVGIGSVVGGDNGAAPDWADIVALETEVAVDNADIGRLAYMTNAKVRGLLKRAVVASGTDASMIWDRGAPNSPLNGYPAYVTNQVSSSLTKGTANGICSAIFFGNWADLVVAFWTGLDVIVNPYAADLSGGVRVTVHQDADIAVRHPQSFAAMLDALTA